MKGSLTELIPDIRHIQPMYSLDGQTWQPCGVEWNLHWQRAGNSYTLTDLQNQICLYDSFEPLKGYLAGRLDRFYLKLRLTRENGMIYETNAAVIERGTVQQVCEEITFTAAFTPSMRVFERNPFCYYGRYQIYVKADAAPQEISALLPDTIPVAVQLQKDKKFIGEGIVDCPVTWKTLSLPLLTAGETVIIPDAAEELVVPAGTLLSTPIGTHQLEKPLRIAQDAIITDEIRPVLPLNPVNAAEVPQPDSSHHPESIPEGQQPDLSRDMGNASEESSYPGTSFNNGLDYESLQSQQDMTPAYRFEYSVQVLTAEAVADICTSVVAVRMKANMISGRMMPQIAGIFSIMLFIK